MTWRRSEIIIGRKLCSRCKSWRLLAEFCRDRHAATGYSCWCKECMAADRRAYYLANRQARIASAKARLDLAMEATQGAAVRSGAPWTAPEDALVSQAEVPLVELALKLGRSYYSVAQRRRKLAARAA